MTDLETKFLDYATQNYNCLKNNNINEANNYAKMLIKIKNEIMIYNNRNVFLDNMLRCDNEMAQLWASGMCIDFGYNVTSAKETLCQLAKSNDEIISRDSKMSLFVRFGI